MNIFIPSIWIAAGMSFYAAIHFGIIGIARRQERVFQWFGLLCLLLSGYMIFSIQWYQAETTEELAWIARVQMGLVCLIYPVFVWYLGHFTDQKISRTWLLAVLLAFGALLVINFFEPLSFLYSEIAPREPILLPWGESLRSYQLTTSGVALFYYAATYAVLGWAVYRAVAMWRQGKTGKAIPIAGYLTLQILTVLHAEIIDNFNIHSVYLGEFAFLGLVIVMSYALGQELRLRSVALETRNVELLSEIDKRRAIESQLRYMAYHDYLTDLPNRRLLLEDLRKALASSRQNGLYSALLVVDLDNFKTINDSLGHEIGDKLLQQVAQRLKMALPETYPPARLGGDEFAIVLHGYSVKREATEKYAMDLARHLGEQIVLPHKIGDHELAVGASIGVATFTGEAGDAGSIIQQADTALYHAKKSGRNSVTVFAPQMERDVNERMIVEKGLRAALEKDQISLHYQPQLSADGQLVGAEALLRWTHPQLGDVLPERFIPIAEETGLIHPIGEYVLHTASRQFRAWQSAGLPVPTRISINVSPWQLSAKGFTRLVIDTANSSGIEPGCLTLEITESSLLHDVDAIARKISNLNDLGIQFSIDDFGTGYSSLALFKELRVDELKIDRSFVRDMGTEPGSKIVDSIISIAMHLGHRVVAEGVETVLQRDMLEKMGCNIFQGYLFSCPQSADQFARWMAARNKSQMTGL